MLSFRNVASDLPGKPTTYIARAHCMESKLAYDLVAWCERVQSLVPFGGDLVQPLSL